jgi:hypothetical protein
MNTVHIQTLIDLKHSMMMHLNKLIGIEIWRLIQGRPADQPTDVHTEHCCVLHGCKYGNDRVPESEWNVADWGPYKPCTVANGTLVQSYPCESCDDYMYDQDGEYLFKHERKKNWENHV